MSVDLVVTNGVVVTSTEMFEGEVAIDGGLIVAVGRESGLPEGRQVLDASGNYILPGLIDPHVHFRDPGLTNKEDYTTGSIAALMGGVTTVLDMPNVIPPTSTAQRVRERERLIEERSHVDVVLIGVIVQDNLDQIVPLAEAGAKVHIFHLSSRDGLECIVDCRAGGVDVTTETEPRYMFLDAAELEPLGSALKMNPPVRTREHGEALYRGLLDGAIGFIASDHAPHTGEEKLRDNIWEAAAGCVGVETMMQVMLSEAVNKRGMALSQFVRIASENAARAWGIYPQKGALQVGTDADITIVDLDAPWTIDQGRLHSKSRVTPWHGWSGAGKPVATIVRGRVLMRDGVFAGGAPRGRLIRPKGAVPT